MFSQFNDPAELIRSRRSAVCPCCDKFKKPGEALAAKCYFKLTPKMRRDLFKSLGHGYAEALETAIAHLHSPHRIHAPDPSLFHGAK